eukprot:GHVU01042084.1.p2 GENE.GHVU01042084.1~~GHVU01042084.1.p2  ORF type:complete len:511 (+),score=113.25 GHVU01042084.1:155-1534(+)
MGPHSLKLMTKQPGGSENSYAACSAACRGSGFAYVAISRDSCYCGNTFRAERDGGDKCEKCPDSNLGCGRNSIVFSVYKATRGIKFGGLAAPAHRLQPSNADVDTANGSGEIAFQGSVHVGCFRVGDFASHKQANQSSPLACADTCFSGGFRYFGMRGAECYCDDYFDDYATIEGDEGEEGEGEGKEGKRGKPVSAENCPNVCAGSYLCGGAGGHLSVYTTRRHPRAPEPHVAYMGCWWGEQQDKAGEDSGPDFEHKRAPDEGSGDWARKGLAQDCWKYCAEKRYSYAALQRGFRCFCGNSFGAKGYGQTTREKCAEWRSREGVLQGGTGANAVYFLQASFGGCFRDEAAGETTEDGTKRGDMPHAKSAATDANLTVESCVGYCLSRGYSYAGLQRGGHCSCSYDAPSWTKLLATAECDKACTGNSRQMCGGEMKNSVYVVGSPRFSKKKKKKKKNNNK